MSDRPGQHRRDRAGWAVSRRSHVQREEFDHYDAVARSDEKRRDLDRQLARARSLRSDWASGAQDWADSPFDAVAQAAVYRHVAPNVAGGTVVQLGGSGLVALKALYAGADHSYLVTPVAGEAELAEALARDLGFGHRFRAVAGTGEAVPLPDNSVDVVVIEACLHHMDVSAALREAWRVLRPGGRFGAFDPWHAALYDFGTCLLGKRDRSVDCRPLNAARLSQLDSVFADSRVTLHGALTRYGFVALGKAGIRLPIRFMAAVTRLDDRISRPFRVLRRNGSSAAVIATKDRADA